LAGKVVLHERLLPENAVLSLFFILYSN
jgi:hypothetical protein